MLVGVCVGGCGRECSIGLVHSCGFALCVGVYAIVQCCVVVVLGGGQVMCCVVRSLVVGLCDDLLSFVSHSLTVTV